jgi:hypothetical protein
MHVLEFSLTVRLNCLLHEMSEEDDRRVRWDCPAVLPERRSGTGSGAQGSALAFPLPEDYVRRHLADSYREYLEGVSVLTIPSDEKQSRQTYQLFVVLLQKGIGRD